MWKTMVSCENDLHSWWIFYTSVDIFTDRLLLVAGQKYAPPHVYVTHDYSRYSQQTNPPFTSGFTKDLGDQGSTNRRKNTHGWYPLVI
jgi:hypothetical protein